MAYHLDDEIVELDYRDPDTVWIHLLVGRDVTLELTRQDLLDLLSEMDQQGGEEDAGTEGQDPTAAQ